MCFQTSCVAKKTSTCFSDDILKILPLMSDSSARNVTYFIGLFIFTNQTFKFCFLFFLNALQQPERLLCLWVCRSKHVLVWERLPLTSPKCFMHSGVRGGVGGEGQGRKRGLWQHITKWILQAKSFQRGGRGGLQTHSCRKTRFSTGSSCSCCWSYCTLGGRLF